MTSKKSKSFGELPPAALSGKDDGLSRTFFISRSIAKAAGTVMAQILVVEDDQDTAESLARFLRRQKHQVMCAGDGHEALGLLMQSMPDVVLLDLRLPEMDGLTFLNVVRSYLRWTSLPVIVVTGCDDDELTAQTFK